MADQIPAGWYPVEGDPGTERYFDGVNWGQTRVVGGPAQGAATTAEFAQPAQQTPPPQQTPPAYQPPPGPGGFDPTQQIPAQQVPGQVPGQPAYGAGLPPETSGGGGGNKVILAVVGGLVALLALGGGAFALFGGGDDGDDIDATGTTVPVATVGESTTTTAAPATTEATTTTTAPTTTTAAVLINCSVAGVYAFDTVFDTCDGAFTRGREIGVEAGVLARADAAVGDLYVGGLCQAVQGTEQRGATQFGAAMALQLSNEVCPGDPTLVIDGLGAELGIEIITNSGAMEEEGVEIDDSTRVQLIRDVLGDRIPALLLVDDQLIIDTGTDLCIIAGGSTDAVEFTDTLLEVWDGLDQVSRDVFQDDIGLYGEFAGAELAAFCVDEFERLFPE